MTKIDTSVSQAPVDIGKRATPRADQGRGALPEKRVTSGDAIVVSASRHGLEHGRLSAINEDLNRIAAGIRESNRTMDRVNEYLEQMKDGLLRIIKNYPPYPPGDPERLRFLQSFNGLKREIERMTIPPTEQWTGYRAPASAPAPQPQVSLGIALPELPDTASDAQIRDAVVSIDKAVRTIGDRQTELRSAAIDIGQQAGYDAKSAEIGQGSAGTVALADLREFEAGPKSESVRAALARESSGLTERQSAFAALAG